MGLVEALAQGRLNLELGADWREARVALSALDGFGPWTVESIAMRSLGDPDAFVAGDLGIRLAARRLVRCHPWGGSGHDPVPPARAARAASKRD